MSDSPAFLLPFSLGSAQWSQWPANYLPFVEKCPVKGPEGMCMVRRFWSCAAVCPRRTPCPQAHPLAAFHTLLCIGELAWHPDVPIYLQSICVMLYFNMFCANCAFDLLILWRNDQWRSSLVFSLTHCYIAAHASQSIAAADIQEVARTTVDQLLCI